MNTTQNLELFQFTQPPEQFPAGMTTTKLDATGKPVSITLALERRKDAASRLGLKGKDNAATLSSALLGISDRMKESALGEFVKLGASPEWTGGRFTLRQAKNGSKRATLTLVSVNRNTHTVSEDQLVKALAMLSEDEQIALLEKATAQQKQPAAIEE